VAEVVEPDSPADVVAYLDRRRCGVCQAELGSVLAAAVSRSRHSPKWRCWPPHTSPGRDQQVRVPPTDASLHMSDPTPPCGYAAVPDAEIGSAYRDALVHARFAARRHPAALSELTADAAADAVVWSSKNWRPDRGPFGPFVGPLSARSFTSPSVSTSRPWPGSCRRSTRSLARFHLRTIRIWARPWPPARTAATGCPRPWPNCRPPGRPREDRHPDPRDVESGAGMGPKFSAPDLPRPHA